MIGWMLRVRSFLIEQDCWYLISGFLMLLGCLLMSQAPGADSVDLWAGLKLQSVVLAYQALVVALAIYVRRRLGVEHDAFNLALVALVLLPDPTFFSQRFWGHSRAAGIAVNAGGLLAASVMLVILVEAGRFPIGRRSLGAWLAALVAVFASGSGFEPGDSAANFRFMDLLVFAPLALAALAARFEPSEESGGLGGEPAGAGTADPHPVLWGRPGRIYRYYFAAVVFGFPFLVMLRHLYGLGAVFLQDLTLARLAPAILGAAVLLVKAFPPLAEASGLLCCAGLFSLLAAATRGADAAATGQGAPLFALMLAANVLVALWVWAQRAERGVPVWATLCAMALAAGSTPEAALQGILEMKAAPMAVLMAVLTLHAALDRGFWEIFGAGLAGVIVLARAVAVPAPWSVLVPVQSAGLLYLLCVHLYPRKDLRSTCPTVAFLMLMLLFPGAQQTGAAGELYRGLLAAELTLCFLAGATTSVRGYAAVALALGALHGAIATGRSARQLDVARLFWTWSGPFAITLAFATLGIGLLASKRKSLGTPR